MLKNEPFVSFHEDQFPGRPKLLKTMFQRASIAPKVVAKAKSFSELLGLVGTGRGVAIAPADLDQFPHFGVIFVKLKRPKLTLVSSALWKKERQTPELLSFINIMAEPTRN